MKKKVVIAFFVILLAFILRAYAALTLPTDYDEPVYYTAARYYAAAIQQGKPEQIATVDYNYEHPAFTKLLYGGVLALLPSDGYISGEVWQLFKYQEPLLNTWNPIHLFVIRMISVVFGTLAVALLTLLSPLAALFLAIDTINIKFTSVVYLEAIPIFLSLLSALLFIDATQWMKEKTNFVFKERIKELILLLLSAICLGIATACKYQYGFIGFAILVYYFVWIVRINTKEAARYWLIVSFAIISLVSFFAADPYLYPNPANNLVHSVWFSLDYQNGEAVRAAGYPFYQPLVWLSHPVTDFLDRESQPMPASGNEFLLRLDTIIFILAIIGLPKLFKDHPLFFTWLVICLAFLLIWNTKWPQYTMLVIVPLCLSASEGMNTLILGIRFLINKVFHKSKAA